MNANMYFDYRIRASKNNAALRNRARAAETLGISETSLSNYETGRTKCIPAEMVDTMASVYNAPELRNIYCMQTCPIGCHMNLASEEATLEQVAVHLYNSAEPIPTNLGKFLRIAGHGKIEATEKQELKEIADIFKNLTFAVSEFSILAERQGVTWS